MEYLDCDAWEAQWIANDRRRRAVQLAKQMTILGRNLVVAGALERAFNLGWNRGYEEGNMYGDVEHDIPYVPSEH